MMSAWSSTDRTPHSAAATRHNVLVCFGLHAYETGAIPLPKESQK